MFAATIARPFGTSPVTQDDPPRKREDMGNTTTYSVSIPVVEVKEIQIELPYETRINL